MPDRYLKFTATTAGRRIARRLGLPTPVPLRRYRPGEPVVAGPVLTGSAAGSRLGTAVASVLKEIEAQVADVRSDGTRYAALIFDATGITASDRLRQLLEFFGSAIRQLDSCGRLVVLASHPAGIVDPHERAAQQALEGFVRTAGKELRRGCTAQLVQVADGAEQALGSTLRFLLSPKSAFVSGQVITVRAAEVPQVDWKVPLRDKVALVTGASRGIGEAVAETLAREGARVVCLDLPAQGERLVEVANRIGGSTLQLDITAKDAPQRLADYFTERHGGLDIVVHNAGITRDKTIGRMSESQWDDVLSVNLGAQEAINDVLLGEPSPLRRGGRLIAVASVSGIAGNVGQANYAASKAGVIGLVTGLAPIAAERGVTVNAVAPGFIETGMTAAIPLLVREAGRRLSGLGQGGLPIDVAETIAWFAHPASAGLNGTTVRVCGQSYLGA
jgi:3-oxoacyl-[acyl-carrier protein] reductase